MEAQGKIADFRYNLQREVNRVQAPAMLTPDRAAMERFLGACHRRRYASKTAIIRPGDSANILYYVIDGSLTVSSEDEEGRELILAYLNRGEFIGEMGLFVETPRREVMIRGATVGPRRERILRPGERLRSRRGDRETCIDDDRVRRRRRRRRTRVERER